MASSMASGFPQNSETGYNLLQPLTFVFLLFSKKCLSLSTWLWTFQDGIGTGGCEIPLPTQTHQEHIYKWNSSAGHPLNTRRGPWTPRRTRKIPTYLGKRLKKKTRKKRRGSWMGPVPLESLRVSSGSHIWGSTLTSREISGDRGQALRTGSMEWHPQRWFMPQPVCPSLRHASISADQSWMPDPAGGNTDLGGDHRWLWGAGPRGWRWGVPQVEMLVEEVWTATEAKCHYWVMCKGRGCPGNFFPQAQAPASTDTGEGSQWSWSMCPWHHLPPPQSGCHTCPAHPWGACAFQLYPRAIPPVCPLAPVAALGSSCLMVGELWQPQEQTHWEEYTQRWGHNESWAPRACDWGRRAETSS